MDLPARQPQSMLQPKPQLQAGLAAEPIAVGLNAAILAVHSDEPVVAVVPARRERGDHSTQRSKARSMSSKHTTVRFTSYPRTEPPPSFVAELVDVFRRCEDGISTVSLEKGLTSDAVLGIIR